MTSVVLVLLGLALSPAIFAQGCPMETTADDERCSFEASVFLGLAIDTFAASEFGNYVYPTVGGAKEASLFGFDFAYRLKKTTERQVWVYGKTMHGVRSADIECKAKVNFPSCAANLGQLLVPVNPGDTAFYILRNASSLEGSLGFRYEFQRLSKGSENPASLYLKAQTGFLKVAGTPGSALGIHKIALGSIVTKGTFGGSYLDVGYGRNDVFQLHRRRRAMIDGRMQRRIGAGFSFFAQMVVDTDVGSGSDSFHTYVGVNLDLGQLF